MRRSIFKSLLLIAAGIFSAEFQLSAETLIDIERPLNPGETYESKFQSQTFEKINILSADGKKTGHRENRQDIDFKGQVKVIKSGENARPLMLDIKIKRFVVNSKELLAPDTAVQLDLLKKTVQTENGKACPAPIPAVFCMIFADSGEGLRELIGKSIPETKGFRKELRTNAFVDKLKENGIKLSPSNIGAEAIYTGTEAIDGIAYHRIKVHLETINSPDTDIVSDISLYLVGDKKMSGSMAFSRKSTMKSKNNVSGNDPLGSGLTVERNVTETTEASSLLINKQP